MVKLIIKNQNFFYLSYEGYIKIKITNGKRKDLYFLI